MTKKELIDFISVNTNDYTRDELYLYRIKELKQIIEDYGLVSVFNETFKKKPVYWVEIVENGKRLIKEYESENKISAVNELQSKGYNISKIVLKHGHHKCKCCGLIADGTSKDILCKECQDKYHVDKYTTLLKKSS